jgi:hypothetical protein
VVSHVFKRIVIPAFAFGFLRLHQAAALGAKELPAVVASPDENRVDVRVVFAIAGLRTAALGTIAHQDSVGELVGGCGFGYDFVELGHKIGRQIFQRGADGVEFFGGRFRGCGCPSILALAPTAKCDERRVSDLLCTMPPDRPEV